MITMRFTNRERYCKAIRHLWAHPDRYKIGTRGKDYGAPIKAPYAECGWYIKYWKLY